MVCAPSWRTSIAAVVGGRVQVVARVELGGEVAQRVLAARHRNRARPAGPRRRRPRAVTPFSVATAAQATMAKSPCRRANSRKAKPSPARAQGNDTASINSSSLRAVDISPVKKSSAATLRRPAFDERITSPPSARRHSGSSALGSANAIDPHTVPRARVCAWPTHGSACASKGWRAARSRPGQQLRLTHRCAGTDRIVHEANAAKFCNVHDVEDHLRPRHAHRQERHQGLPAGDHGRVAAFGGEHVVRLGETSRHAHSRTARASCAHQRGEFRRA